MDPAAPHVPELREAVAEEDYRAGGPSLLRAWLCGQGFKLARRGTCTTLPGTKLPHQVVDKASKLHASNAFGNYNLIYNNCEHFATFCQANIRKSKQTAFVSNCERKFKGAKEWTTRLLQRNRI
ncbi:hypothetical protein NL676_020207 [Syzygium grande]|nr:hypothetical protein NL676_020207 [Syzygium grande]